MKIVVERRRHSKKNHTMRAYRIATPKIATGLIIAVLSFIFLYFPHPARAITVLEATSGHIVLQVERNGEAWYVDPVTDERMFLGRPDDAFALLYDVGLGITNAELSKIPTAGQTLIGDFELRRRLAGRILLQVERNGEAWYVYPKNLQRYYLGRAHDAFQLMTNLGLGISDSDLAQIPESQDPVLSGAGDISTCDNNNDEQTAGLLDRTEGLIFTLGDNAYQNGSLSDYQNCYQPTWGRHKEKTYPSLGNHEYRTPGAAGYFSYWGSRVGQTGSGYYRYSINDWQVYVLDSNCTETGGCHPGSVQYQWLQHELQKHPSRCSIAYMHHPRFSSGIYGDHASLADFWNLFQHFGVDIVMAGHEHEYERFAPLDADGQIDYGNGTRMFVVGTGGRSLRPFNAARIGSEVRLNAYYGVLKLTLHHRSYAWDFLTAPNATIKDTGTYICH